MAVTSVQGVVHCTAVNDVFSKNCLIVGFLYAEGTAAAHTCEIQQRKVTTGSVNGIIFKASMTGDGATAGITLPCGTSISCPHGFKVSILSSGYVSVYLA